MTRGTVSLTDRRSPSTAFEAAVLPCTPARWVYSGCGVTSPAAQTVGREVRILASTTTWPDPSVRTPTASSPRPSVRAVRPVATSTTSAANA